MKKARWLALFLALALLPVFTPSARRATYMVTNTTDSGSGSLRQAIIDANNNPGPDTIAFNIPKSDPGYITPDNVWFIWPNSPLPCLDGDGTTIDGFTQTTNQGDQMPRGRRC